MQKFFSILALFVLAFGVFFAQKTKVKEVLEPSFSVTPSVIPEKVEEDIKGGEEENGSGNKDIKTDTFLEKPDESLSPTPTTFSQQLPSIYESYKYPGSLVLDFSYPALILRSKDDPEAITQWYKKKITSDGFNVKTFVTTKANGKILNRLVGSQSEEEIDVEITKEAGEEFVKIKVIIKQK